MIRKLVLSLFAVMLAVSLTAVPSAPTFASTTPGGTVVAPDGNGGYNTCDCACWKWRGKQYCICVC